jgi:hypothetical protein
MRAPRPTPVVVVFATWVLAAMATSSPAAAQVVATVPEGITPPWSNGIQAINSANYWNAVECGKKGGANPACVFWDTGICKNGEFTLVMYTPYKQVAYTVWLAVSKKQPAPTPSYSEAQRQRIVLGITPLHGAQNPITSVAVKRGGKTLLPATQQLANGGGSFFFDYATFAATGSLSIEMVGKATTVSCAVSQATLARMR